LAANRAQVISEPAGTAVTPLSTQNKTFNTAPDRKISKHREGGRRGGEKEKGEKHSVPKKKNSSRTGNRAKNRCILPAGRRGGPGEEGSLSRKEQKGERGPSSLNGEVLRPGVKKRKKGKKEAVLSSGTKKEKRARENTPKIFRQAMANPVNTGKKRQDHYNGGGEEGGLDLLIRR